MPDPATLRRKYSGSKFVFHLRYYICQKGRNPFPEFERAHSRKLCSKPVARIRQWSTNFRIHLQPAPLCRRTHHYPRRTTRSHHILAPHCNLGTEQIGRCREPDCDSSGTLVAENHEQ